MSITTTVKHSPTQPVSRLPLDFVGPLSTALDSPTLERLIVEGTLLEEQKPSRMELVLTPEQIVARERSAFLEMKPRLLGSAEYPNKFVAIINGTPVDSDNDKGALVERIYATRGYIPVFIGKVTEEQKRYRRLPSPRRA